MDGYTPYQQRIIKRYYEHNQEGAFQKLEELVTDIYLADTEKKKAALWKRVEKALVNLNAPPKLVEHLLEKKDPEVLARNLKDWWTKMPKEPPKPERPPG